VPLSVTLAFGLSMELFGLLLAMPVTFVASFVYAALALALFSFLPVVARVLVSASLFVIALIVTELVLFAALGPKGTYAHLGHGFTALHFLGFLLGPPAVANLVFHVGCQWNLNRWLRFFSATGCCWITCMSALLGNIVVDEAIVGIDAGKPFYMTPPRGPNKVPARNARIALPLQSKHPRPGVGEVGCSASSVRQNRL
jgi:hypothetical protein